MRVKLQFGENLLSRNRRRKVCYLVDKDACKKVTDLCYLIHKRFFPSIDGRISLFLDEFFFPPQEDINIIQENDILDVRFSATSKTKSHGVVNGHHHPRKRKKEQSSSSSSPASDVKKETVGKSVPIKRIKSSPSVIKAGSNTPALDVTVKQRTLPLSKLGITSGATAVKSTSSSSSDSSSSSSSSDDENVNKKIQADKNNVATKKTSNNVKTVSFTANKSSISNLQKTPLESKIKKDDTSSDSSTTSSSDNDSDSDSSAESAEESKMKDNKNKDTNVSEVDFNVANLPKGATSTPASMNTSTPASVNASCKKQKKNSSNVRNNNFAKALASKDVYTNSSQVIVNNISFDAATTKGSSLNTGISKGLSLEESYVIANGNINNSSSDVRNLTDKSVSGKTLRNRRRRQRRLEIAKIKKTECKDVDNQDSKPKEASDITSENKPNDAVKVEPKIETLSNGTMDAILAAIKSEVKSERKDYSTYKKLTEPPVAGSVIAYKILEMSQSYTPEISEYKEAILNNHDKESGLADLQLSQASLQTTRGDGNVSRRFENDDELYCTVDEMISIRWVDLLDVRLIL